MTGQGWLYLVAVLDLCTRRVIGWAMHQILDSRLVSAALRMALLQRRPRQHLIVHSDRGSQFASAAYRQLLAQHGLTASMSRPGNCYDNAFIESFWSSLKYEVVYHQRFATFAEARSAIFNYIETFYNRNRLHSSLAYRSPDQFESQLNQTQNRPKELILQELSEKPGQAQTDPFSSFPARTATHPGQARTMGQSIFHARQTTSKSWILRSIASHRNSATGTVVAQTPVDIERPFLTLDPDTVRSLAETNTSR